MKERLLLLLVPLLLIKHFNIVLRNVGEGVGRYNDTEIIAKNFLFCLCIINLGIITGLSDKLNRTSKA